MSIMEKRAVSEMDLKEAKNVKEEDKVNLLTQPTENGTLGLQELAKQTTETNIKKSFKIRMQPSGSSFFTAGYHKNATVEDIEVKLEQETNFCIKDLVFITYKLPNGATHVQKYFYYLSFDSQLGEVVKALLGPVDAGEEIELADLIGKICNIIVENRVSKRGTKWLNVKEVLPIE